MCLKNRYEVMALVSVSHCCHNGDPEFGNMPRMDYTTEHGIITDVAFKSRIRRYVLDAFKEAPGLEILMKDRNSLNKCIAEARTAANVLVDKETEQAGKAKKGKNENDTEKVMRACRLIWERYWDVRTFGAVLSSGMNAGQVRGAVQIQMASSVDPVEQMDLQITRCCFADGKFTTVEAYEEAERNKPDGKKRTFGRKQTIPYGLFVLKMSVSANLAEKVGFSEEDFKILLEALVQMYNHDVSSSKMGMSVLTPVIVFKHVGTDNPDTNPEQLERERKLGCAPAYKLFDLLDIKRKDDVEVARSYKDYNIKLHLEDLPAGVECGFKTNAFSDVEWTDVRETVDLLEI